MQANSRATYVGEIVTLSFQARNVRLVPETNGTNENAPSHRVYVGRAEIGAAWAKRSSEGRDYLSVKLDDPSFNAPIYANLFDEEGTENYTLKLGGRVVYAIGRYFGPFPRGFIIGRALPVFTDEAGDGRFVWRAATR